MNQKSAVAVLVVVIIFVGAVYLATISQNNQPVVPVSKTGKQSVQPSEKQLDQNSNVQEQASLINNRFDIKNSDGYVQTYNISYPLGWDKTDLGMEYGQHKTSLIKKLATNDRDYICVDLEFRTKDFYKHYNDPDEWKLTEGSIIKNLGKGYSLYSWKDNSMAYITDKDMKNVAALSNNIKLGASMSFNCVQGDIDNLTLNYNQQVNSQEYQEAINILESLVKNLE